MQLKFVPLTCLIMACAACSSPKTAPAVKEEKPAPKTSLETLASNCAVDEFKINGLRPVDGLGLVFFAHPGSNCSLPVTPGSRFVRFGFGILDGALLVAPKTEGVKFSVSAVDATGSSTLLWTSSLNPAKKVGDRGPQQQILPVDESTMKRLVFETKPLGGPRNNWSYWKAVEMSSDLNYFRLLSENKLIDEFQINGLRPEGQEQILFAHPHSRFSLPLSKDMKSVHFAFGILDAAIALTPPPPGVEFRLLLQTPGGEKKVWSQTLRPATVAADRGRHQGTITLDASGGRLVFETLPVGVNHNEWSYWADVRVP